MPYIVGDCLLRDLLLKKNMTQTQLAERLNVTPQQINHYAQNNRVMSIQTAMNISEILNCAIEDLYQWIEVGMKE